MIFSSDCSVSLIDHSQEVAHEKKNTYSSVKGHRKNPRSRRPPSFSAFAVEKIKLFTVNVSFSEGSIPVMIAVFNPAIFAIVALFIQASVKLPLSAVIH